MLNLLFVRVAADKREGWATEDQIDREAEESSDSIREDA